MASCFIFGSKTIFQGKVRLLSALLEWVGFKFFASGVNLFKKTTLSAVLSQGQDWNMNPSNCEGQRVKKVLTFFFYFGQLATLVPSALKANKFSGPPAFWSPPTCFGPPHMCAVCVDFEDRDGGAAELSP